MFWIKAINLIIIYITFYNNNIYCEGGEGEGEGEGEGGAGFTTIPITTIPITTTPINTFPITTIPITSIPTITTTIINPCDCPSECNKQTCENLGEKCRFFIEGNYCLECTDLSEENPYYTINSNQCGVVEEKPENGRLILGEYEVFINNCPSSYPINLGDFCYPSSSSNILQNEDSPYQCINYFYIENINGYKYYNCLDSDKNCYTNNGFNIEGTKQCFNCPSNYKYYYLNENNFVECYINSCPEAKPYKNKESNNYNSIIYRCTDGCKSNEFKYIEKDDSNNIINQYCINTCPNEAKYYYELNHNDLNIQSMTCLSSCDINHYSIGNKCTTDCNVITVDLNKKIFSCINKGEITSETDINCPPDFPYLYKHTNNNNNKYYCLKTCKDTKDKYFKINPEDEIGVLTYLNETIDENQQIIKQCLLENIGFYIDEISLKWVKDCKTSASGPYHNATHCKNSCENYFTIKDLKCIDDCEDSSDYQYLDEETKTCYDKCPSNLGRGFHNNDNKCQSCDIPLDESNPIAGKEGFYKSDDNTCLPSCEDNYYHNIGENFCFEDGCVNKNGYEYQPYNSRVCYLSCSDIGDGSYKIEIDKKCYQEFPDSITLSNYYFYKKPSGIKKYILKNNAFEECSQQNLKYLKDSSECVKECDENDYIVLQKGNEFGKCFSNLSLREDIYKYYNKTKILSEECNYLKILILNPDTTQYIETEIDGENCVTQCPDDFYEYVDEKECKKEYNNDYYVIEESNKKKCITEEKCTKFKFIPSDEQSEKKCVDKCTVQNRGEKYSYYNSNKFCFDSCINNNESPNNLFSNEATNDHLQCINSCSDNLHYYEDQKVCVNDCGNDYYSSSNKEICVKHCAAQEYIYPGNICSTEVCPSSAPFYYETNITITVIPANDGDENTQNITVKKCVPNCKGNELNYEFYEIDTNDVNIKKCVMNCPDLSYNGRCYNGNCPDGLYISGYECVPKCTPNIFKEKDGNLICISSCPNDEEDEEEELKFITSYGKCVKQCPEEENYISKDGVQCLTNCGNDFFEKTDSTNGINYDIYKCVSNCGDKVHIEGTKECIPECTNDLYLYEASLNNTCYHNCLSTNKPFSTISNSDSKKICDTQCNGEDIYYGNDKICMPNCSHLYQSKIIDELNNECVSQCKYNSSYKFLQEKETNNNPHCQQNCDNNYDRYIMPNYVCSQNCEEPNNFVVLNNSENQIQCLNKCPSNYPYAQYDSDRNEFFCTENICDNTSDYKYYYFEDKICLDVCKGDDYIKEGTNICLTSCQTQNLYFDDENKICVYDCKTVNGKNYTKIDGHCDEKCNDEDYYNENDLICRIRCPIGQKIDNHICRENCSSSTDNKYEDENGMCVEKCENSKTGYIYYNRDFGNKCQNSCLNKFIKGNTCVNSCEENEIGISNPSITKFLDDNICVSQCPITKRFFVNDSNESPQYKCLTDCPINFTYYSIITDSEFTDPFYACKNNCPAYIMNNDQNINAKLCYDDGICLRENQFYIYDNNLNKQCLSQCPSDKPYYKSDSTEDFECLNECPDNYAHMPDLYICEPISDCESKKINYIKKECVNECPRNYKIFKKNDIIYCIENCTVLDSSFSGATPLLLTNEDECVSSCPTNTEIKPNNICDCIKLFYYDKSTGKKICLSSDKDICKSAGIDDYKISIAGTNECSYYCDGVLSSSGYECYRNKEYNCSQNEKLITLNNGDKVCDCIDKYYYAYNDNGKEKKCLQQGDNCNSPFELLITETKECVNICPDDYKYKFQKTCVSSCPESTKKDEERKECICEDKWYIDKNSNKAICLKNNCTEEYPLLINDTRQCVSSCIGTGYEIYYEKECIQNCNNERTKISTNGDSFAQKYAEYKCKCNGIWYYDEITQKEKCNDVNDENDCNTFSNSKYKYKIESTKQCVSNCNGDFPYEFNNLCFKNCEDYTGQDIIISQDNPKKCICREYSELTENNDNEYTKCLTLEFCKNNKDIYSIIEAPRQCYKKENDKNCPKKYPIYFNGYCYKENDCPENTNYNPYEQKCKCNYKWYNENSIITCLSNESNCPSQYPLLVFSTDECKKENDLNLLEFNYILYGSCPKNTIKSETSNECICDNNNFWYEDQTSDGKKFLYCGLEECPNSKPYINEGNSNKECLPDCGNKYLYRGICYEKCPELTEVGNNNECVLSPVNNEITLDKLEQTITSKLVELYKKSNIYNEFNSTSSQKIVTTNATVEFYGVNKNNKGKSEDNIQSDLSYIDISECVEKIYKSNGMKNDDDIIILKFDLNNAPENFLINPVEYKFVNSRTGQELDASVCEHNSIKISYPLHNLIYRYDNRKNKKRKLEYMQLDLTSNNRDSLREKLDKGKEIREKYSYVDIFNINDILYSDICIAFEVDGKDLLLQDRINYLYPDMSLCENNCTYNHTDFINERIYCDCSFKKEFDFKREYSSSIEINTEQIKNDQGSNSNINVIKCISNLKNKKSLSGNGGFIFLIIVIIIEFILLLIIIFYGIGSLLNKLKKKMKKDDNEEYDKIELNVVTTNNNNNDKKENEKEKEKETQRKLNVPPKKKGEYGMEFIPQEYVFLFFNQNEKGVIKKVERDGVPFKTNYNTRILLEKIKGVNYDNIKSRGPFPGNQNVLVIVDNMNDSLSDYIYDDESDDKFNNRIKNTEENNINNYEDGNNKTISHKNKHRKKNKNNDDLSEKFGNKAKMYSKKKLEYSISDYDPSDENYSEIDFDEDENNEKGFIESIKKEQRLIKKNYDIASQNQKSSNFITMLFTEIIDKIYITKILLFTRKFDILSLQLSIYFLCHTLLLILLALFYDIKTIEKIWNKENYPGLGYYLLYGLISCIIIWIIYTIILCLWSNNDKIKEILRLIHASQKYGVNKENIIKKKYNSLSYKIKFKIAIYTFIEFLLLAFCFIYFVTFCTVYTGTMNKVFKSYGIALIEVLIIKIIYGIVLAILRRVSLNKGKKTLYDVVLFMDTYLV